MLIYVYACVGVLTFVCVCMSTCVCVSICACAHREQCMGTHVKELISHVCMMYECAHGVMWVCT